MINIVDVIKQLKNLYKIEPKITFDLPEYERFLADIKALIYENHFETTSEWELISDNLIYKSTEVLIRQEADIILVQLEKLHRRLMAQENEGCWSYIHPQIMAASQKRLLDGHYADSVESAFKEINSRLKKIYRNQRVEEKDGADLMRHTFTPNNPILTFEGLKDESGRNVQQGYMEMFSGAMTGIRNPKAHENQTISRDAAIKRLIFASLLMDKIDEALAYSNIAE